MTTPGEPLKVWPIDVPEEIAKVGAAALRRYMRQPNTCAHDAACHVIAAVMPLLSTARQPDPAGGTS